jgi:hypothetical protein
MKIEILAHRNPDGPGSLDVFIDGVKVDDYAEHWVDPGAGHMLSEWRETRASMAGDERLSPAYRAAVVQAMADVENSEYIVDDREPPWDVAWTLHDSNELVALWQDYANLHENEKDQLDGFACEQVSRALVTALTEAGWDAWLVRGSAPDEADGLLGEHYWVGVDDEGMVQHIDLTAQQFTNLAGHGEDVMEWPLTWHDDPARPRHVAINYTLVERVEA